MRQALAQQHAAQVAANHAALAKQIKAAAQKKVEELVNVEEETSEKATHAKTTNGKPLDDDTAPR